MYINTFKYQPADVSCQLCTEYRSGQGCTTVHCPWLAERIEAGVVGYREAVLETIPRDYSLYPRLSLLIRAYPGTLWSNIQHEKRMENAKAIFGYRRRRDTPRYYAAMYLLTTSDDLFRRTFNCFCKDKIEFDYATLRSISFNNYVLYVAARDIYTQSCRILSDDLADPETTDFDVLRLIVNANLIARYGLNAFSIRKKEVKRD